MEMTDDAKPWDLVNGSERVLDTVALERYEICKTCEHFRPIPKTCKKCGCFMKMKTTLAKAKCPVGKW